ncbi:MAG TPA: zinc transporter ZupT [Phycisphaerales bacterium]|mgnify:CR=1 FL=1|nr:zinc transporter ZupT [Phycisphaerales bacterium]
MINEYSARTILFAFGLTLLAGLSTGIGSAVAYFAKRTNVRFLSVALGFSAGVMIYISLVEIFHKALEDLQAALGNGGGYWAASAAFFGGMGAIALIDRLVPSYENPHEPHTAEQMEDRAAAAKQRKLHRMGVLTALAIAIHNFPEGLATFMAALTDPHLGIAITVAVAIHNIPEGIAVSVPIFYATGSRKKAFVYSFLSGLSEPVGALVGFGLLFLFFNEVMLGVVFASVAGIMVFISLDELLPAAREYGEHHLSIYGVVAGMAVMAISLALFE